MLHDSYLKDGTISADLIRSAVAGNPQCREQLLIILVSLFQRLAARACDKLWIRNDQETVQDLVSDLVHHFLDNAHGECWRMARWLDNQAAPFEHYATAVASRLLVTRIIALQRRNQKEVEFDEDLAVRQPQHGRDGLAEDVRRCMSMLPQDYQDVLALKYQDELSGEEIARLMDRTPNATYQLLHRAKAELRRLVNEAMNDGSTEMAEEAADKPRSEA